jgi:biofilm PGA synthesis N-glycosyltransferase PgaC
MPGFAEASVGVMAFNEERNIARTLEALTCQMRTSERIREIVVVDSGSEDGTVKIAEGFARTFPGIRLIREEHRRGKASAVNLFCQAAEFPVCVLVNADTVPESGAIDRLVEPHDRPDIGMTGGRPVPVFHDGDSPLWKHIGSMIWEMHHLVNMIADRPKLGEMVAFRRDVIRNDPLTRSSVDEVDIELKIIRAGFKLLYVPEAVVYLRTPRGLSEFLSQRRRIYCGHLLMALRNGYAPVTMNRAVVFRAALKGFRRFLLPPRAACYSAIAFGAELLARGLGWWDFLRGVDHTAWRMVGTTKESIHVP